MSGGTKWAGFCCNKACDPYHMQGDEPVIPLVQKNLLATQCVVWLPGRHGRNQLCLTHKIFPERLLQRCPGCPGCGFRGFGPSRPPFRLERPSRSLVRPPPGIKELVLERLSLHCCWCGIPLTPKGPFRPSIGPVSEGPVGPDHPAVT